MSITAVLNVYKRPHTLIEQLYAIQNQSIPPENIIIWKNYVEGIDMPEIPENLKQNVSIIESSKNFGVWSRFICGLLVSSTYICVFDDDTIPGKDWFKNCIETMQIKCGLLGTIGLRFNDPCNYWDKEPRIGWDGPNQNIEQVDIVGHAWFFCQEWLHYLWECVPDYNIMFNVGEDIGFSYILQKHGINTYVPPHPSDNPELWGSTHRLAYLYGNDDVATSAIVGVNDKFNVALKYYIDKGFKLMNDKPYLNGNMKDHLEQILQKIKNGESFGLIRPGDDEYLILENSNFTASDGWTNYANNILREQLATILKIKKRNLFIGIPCNTCNHSPPNIYDNYINKYKVNKKQITYANIFCNSNWKTFIDFLHKYDKGFYLIANGTELCDFPIKEQLVVDKYLVNNWDNVWESETNRIINYIKDKQNELICFASGPITKIWIPICMEVNPNNIYLDIGYSLDYYIKGTQNARPYTDPNSPYSKECCVFI